jgi:hypothetical protein
MTDTAPTKSSRRRKEKKALREEAAPKDEAKEAARPQKAPKNEVAPLPDGPVSPRQLRQRNRELLRSKAKGTVKISLPSSTTAVTAAAAPKANRRIVFDDEYTATQAEVDGSDKVLAENETNVTPPSDKATTVTHPEEDDDDDDAVEEVKTSSARESETKKRLQERESARAVVAAGKKKRKRKKVETTDDLDEDFFQQLEEEKATEKARLKQQRKLDKQPKGRYTSFVVDEENEDDSMPLQAEFDVQVAVIRPDLDLAFTAPSAEANLFSRNQLEHGGDGLSAKQIQKAKKNGKKAVENSTWQRSTKMNRILVPGRRNRGGPAVHFVKKK